MRLFASLGLAGACLAAAALSAAGAEPVAACGSPGKPACPLQHWMRVHAAAPLATANFGALERSLLRIAALNPDPAKWGNWTKIAKDGAAAARQRDAGDVRGACGRCHRAYRRAYNARFRQREIAGE